MSDAQHVVSRAGWEPGPWDGEPDKLNWKTEAGLPGMIVRNRMGALCGYVAVAKGHPFYGIGYDEAEGRSESTIEVHGGLTYSNRCAGHVCHVPEPGEPDDVWWFGFDCNHGFDVAPSESRRRLLNGGDAEYRDVAYVRAEVEKLARQLAAVADDGS